MTATGERQRRPAGWFTSAWHRVHRYLYHITFTIVVVVTLLLILCVHFRIMGTGTGTFLAVLGATMVAALLVNETREDRITQHRPYILVDFLNPHEERIGDIVTVEGSYLNVRNVGTAVATNIRLRFKEKIRGNNGKDVSENDLLRRGINLLAPGYVMSLKLADKPGLNSTCSRNRNTRFMRRMVSKQ